MNERKEIIRQFYECQIEDAAYVIDGFGYFIPDKRIGRVELVTTGDWGEYGCEADFDSVEIETIQQAIPQTVIEAFERHTWFSQHSLSNVFAFKIPIEGHDTYAIGVSGIAGDGWDNAGHFIEVFDESGVFLGATSIGEGEKIVWLNRYIDAEDFNAGVPKWSGSPDSARDSDKRWSKEMAVSIEQDGGTTRLIMFAPDSR